MSASQRESVVVAAAVIETSRGFLMTRRLAGTHLEGRWEFPGGKCEPAESLEACLRRELFEELALVVEVGPEMCVARHAYAERDVELHFFRCTPVGLPVPQLGQEMRWIEAADLTGLDLPEADAVLIDVLVGRTPHGRD